MAYAASSTIMTASILQLTQHSQPNFVTPLTGKYICTHCGEGLKHPVRQSECGHRFCSTCVESLLVYEGVSMCPAKEDGCFRLTEKNIYPDRGTEREMGKLLVHCENYPKCKEEIEWRHLSKHMPLCDFNLVSCSYSNHGCAAQFPHKNKQRHLSECKHRPHKCRFCYNEVPYMQITDHETECQEIAAFCDYKPEGCQFEGRRKDVQEHMTFEMAYHLQLVRNVLRDAKATNISLKQQVQQLTTKCNEHENDVAASNTDLTQFKRLMDTNTLEMQKSMSRQMEQTKKLDKDSKALGAVSQQTKSLESKITNLEQKQSGTHQSGNQTLTEEEKARMRSQDQTVAMHAAALSEYEIRFRCLETANHNGDLVWKITNYRSRKDAAITGRTLSIYSQPFYTDPYGYKMCARLYLDGDGMGKRTHASLYFVVMKGEYDALLTWPFRQRVTMILLDQENGRNHIQDTFRPDPTSSSFQRPVNTMNIASGSPLFVAQTTLESGKYLRNDSIYIMMKVDLSDLNHFGI